MLVFNNFMKIFRVVLVFVHNDKPAAILVLRNVQLSFIDFFVNIFTIVQII